MTHALFDAAAFLPRRSGHAQGVSFSYEGPIPKFGQVLSFGLIRVVAFNIFHVLASF